MHYAVIGAGIGGCSAAYFIRRYFPRSRITLYERDQHIGGRILTTKIGSWTRELGAVFFTSHNTTLNTLIQELNLRVRSREDAHNYAIWNGTDFTFKSHQSQLAQMLQLLSTYRISVVKLRALIQNARKQVFSLYDHQRKKPSEMRIRSVAT